MIAPVSYPPIRIRNVPPDMVWRCYNAGNYPYFLKIIREIENGTCPFCQIDTRLNKEIEGISNPSWRVWDNPISKLGGPEAQVFQFVIPLKRHIVARRELTEEEQLDLFRLFDDLDDHFGIDGGGLVVRWGNPLRCARSVDHFHANYHVPTGHKDVHPWLAKSSEGLERKRLILDAFETMRTTQGETGCDVETAFGMLMPGQQELVKDLLTPEGRC